MAKPSGIRRQSGKERFSDPVAIIHLDSEFIQQTKHHHRRRRHGWIDDSIRRDVIARRMVIQTDDSIPSSTQPIGKRPHLTPGTGIHQHDQIGFALGFGIADADIVRLTDQMLHIRSDRAH